MKTLTRKKNTENIILVQQDTGTTLVIADHEVHGNAIKQGIVWKLDTSLSAGNFNSFEWVAPAPLAATFDTPEISADGDSLTIGDHNGPSAQKNVRHAYMITVEMNGLIYTSRTTQPEMLVRDPVIINK